jgi:hypothetical protein
LEPIDKTRPWLNVIPGCIVEYNTDTVGQPPINTPQKITRDYGSVKIIIKAVKKCSPVIIVVEPIVPLPLEKPLINEGPELPLDVDPKHTLCDLTYKKPYNCPQ